MNYISILEAIAYFAYSISMITLGIIVNKRLYKNVKNEEHLEKGKIIQRIMKTHSLVQCIAWPCLIVMAFLLKMNKHLHLDFIPQSYVGYIIGIQRFLNTLNGCYGGFNSLIMAISRYVCIVHYISVDGYGVRKVRKFLIGSSIGIPIFLAILTDALVPVEYIWEILFLPNNNVIHNSQGNNGTSQLVNPKLQIALSPFYYLTNTYLPSELFCVLKLVWTALMFLLHSNILEGIIYLHTYIYYRRTQNKTSVKNGLSDDSRERRHQRFTISIQMTVTSWSLELLTGIITLINAFIFAHDAALEISIQVLVAIHTFLYFVVIPGSYLLSTQVYRNLIFDKGWHIVIPCRKNRRQVTPEPIREVQLNVVKDEPSTIEENQSELVPKPRMAQKRSATPIPTISGNVNLETSYVVY